MQDGFVSPVANDYLLTDEVGIDSFAKCDGAPCLKIKAKLGLKGDRTHAGQITVDYIDGSL